MAYLPTVNEFPESVDKDLVKEKINKIVKSLKMRFDVSTLSTRIVDASPKLDEEIKPASIKKEGINVNILKRLYAFIVSDEYAKEQTSKFEKKEKEITEKEDEERELTIIKYVAIEGEKENEEKEEGILIKLFRYYSYYKMGKFAYDHWSQIEKFLGIEGLSTTISNISKELGIDKIIDSISHTIEDIMSSFSERTGINLGSFGGEGTDYVPDGLTKNERSKEAMKFFMSKGWTKEQSAGLVGNLMVESGGFSEDVISGQKKGDSGKAVGIAQWHADRQENFKKRYGKSIEGSSFKEQLDFVNYELTQGQERGAGKQIKATTSAEESARVTDIAYERSSGEHRGKRVGYAKALVSEDLTTTPATTPATTPTPATTTVTTTAVSQTFPATDTGKATRVPKSSSGPLGLAQSFLGKSEGNAADELNAFIVQNFGSFNVKKTPWCAAFVNSVLHASGYKGTGRADAKSFLNMPGIVYDRLTEKGNVQDAKPGDIAIFTRKGGGHVAFVKSVDMTGITVVGGNQSDNSSGGQVSTVKRGFKDLLGIRRPGESGEITLLSKNQPGTDTSNALTKSPSDIKGIQDGKIDTGAFMEEAKKQYLNVTSFMSDLNDPVKIKEIEDKLQNNFKDIPRKEKMVPNLGQFFQQNTTIINNKEEKRYISSFSTNHQEDLPAMFIDPGLPNG
jgi:uncharacterized protein (TIGR02594 family)